ncbi:hypothetical protein RA27_15250 [Ruegeria sp. ANG-R]|nr:hypothetical protein RA27_15250 [Ruegeria sp. ANG-R]
MVRHRRSRVETKVHYVTLVGQSLMALDFDRQVAEIQVRIAVLSRFAWHTHHRRTSGKSVRGKGKSDHNPICATKPAPTAEPAARIRPGKMKVMLKAQFRHQSFREQYQQRLQGPKREEQICDWMSTGVNSISNR